MEILAFFMVLSVVMFIILAYNSDRNKILKEINKAQAVVIANQQGAIDAYKRMFANGVTLAPDGFPIFEDGEKKSSEIVRLETCVWNKDQHKKVQHTYYAIQTEKDYGNSRRPDTFENIVLAIQAASTKRNKGDEYDVYHNGQTEIITKVTTIKEIVAIVKPEEKK